MEEFDYKVSVIVPVYNAEKYLRNCLDSLLNQGLENNEVQVLIINDGSTDGSRKIAEDYCSLFENFRLYSKENEGLSATRNFGLKVAKGKYIAFLDADDTLKENSLFFLCDFFDKHYEEIDIVTYPIVRYKNNQTLPLHYRYKYLNSTGIYDLKEFPYISQANINIMVKNIGCAISFDSTPNFRHEDMKFNNDYLKDKGKIGFVKEAEYKYNRDNDGSIIASYMYAYYIFETSTEYWESLFSEFPDAVPKYYQAIFFNDLVWKFAEGRLWPYHYEETELEIAKARIYALLNKVDIKVILEFPNADIYQKLYWIRQKKNINPTIVLSKEKMQLMCSEDEIYTRKKVEIILKRILVKNNVVKIIGYFKSPLFPFLTDVRFIANDNGNCSEIETCIASSSYHKSKEQTDMFYQFIYEVKDCSYEHSIEFDVILDGVWYTTEYWNAYGTPFFRGKVKKYSTHELVVEQRGVKVIQISPTSKENEKAIKRTNNDLFKNDTNVYNIRKLITNYEMEEEIWLYYDNYTVDYDNGFLQFQHDISKKDNVKRYYVVSANNYETILKLVNEDCENYIVIYGSMMHKILYLNADKIFTSFIEHFSLTPFNKEVDAYISDLFDAEIIYLQHGILHAHLPWFYTPIGVNIDKIVVSSKYETDNLSKNYGFRKNDIWECGAPRYSQMRDNEPKNRILFAPSWRSYLIGEPNFVEGRRTGDYNKFVNSNYYQNIMDFLNDDMLKKLMQENDLFIDVKLHPNFFRVYGEQINFSNTRVSMCPNKIDLSNYKAFITDFSSYVFDYAYLKRPIMYYIPDYLEFKSGMNRYRELDMPLDEAFGPWAYNKIDAITNIRKCIENRFQMEEIYKERLETFFVEMDDPCEKIYKLSIGDIYDS